jgi:hypothetical protein
MMMMVVVVVVMVMISNRGSKMVKCCMHYLFVNSEINSMCNLFILYKSLLKSLTSICGVIRNHLHSEELLATCPCPISFSSSILCARGK